MYYYILGCGIACLVLFGIYSMETVCVKPAEMVGKVLLWPVTLMEAVVRYSSTHHNFKAALSNASRLRTLTTPSRLPYSLRVRQPFCCTPGGRMWYTVSCKAISRRTLSCAVPRYFSGGL